MNNADKLAHISQLITETEKAESWAKDFLNNADRSELVDDLIRDLGDR